MKQAYLLYLEEIGEDEHRSVHLSMEGAQAMARAKTFEFARLSPEEQAEFPDFDWEPLNEDMIVCYVDIDPAEDDGDEDLEEGWGGEWVIETLPLED